MKDHIKNINFIFWGVIIIMIDFSYSWTSYGKGYKFDLFNDFFGSIMLLIGIWGLSKIRIQHKAYILTMKVCLTASFVQIFLAFSDFYVYNITQHVESVLNIINLIIDFSLVLFSTAMIILSQKAELTKSLKHWTNTKNLLFWIHFLPFAILTVISEIMTLIRGYRFNWDVEFGLEGLSYTIASLITLHGPIIYTLYTMHVTKKEIKHKL